MDKDELRKEFYGVMNIKEPFGNEYHEDLFEWMVNKIDLASKQKLNLSGIVSKRPSDQEILQVLDLAQCELREMLKRNKYMGSTALFAVDNLYEVLKAACDSEKGGEKSVSGGNMGTYKPGDERYGG